MDTPEPDQYAVDAVLAASAVSRGLDKRTVDSAATQALDEAAMDATLDNNTQPPRWGNPSGLSVLKKLDKMEERIRQLEEGDIGNRETIARLEEEDIGNKEKIAKLERDVTLLKKTSDGYLDIRNRAFAVMRCDLMDQPNAKDRRIIKHGNQMAHEGDVLSDAEMFSKGKRTDTQSFIFIYGFHYLEVAKFEGQEETLEVLNDHATAVWSAPWKIGFGGHGLTNEHKDTTLGNLHVAFQKFCAALDSGCDLDYLENPDSEIYLAYDTYWSAHEAWKADPTMYRRLRGSQDSPHHSRQSSFAGPSAPGPSNPGPSVTTSTSPALSSPLAHTPPSTTGGSSGRVFRGRISRDGRTRGRGRSSESRGTSVESPGGGATTDTDRGSRGPRGGGTRRRGGQTRS